MKQSKEIDLEESKNLAKYIFHYLEKAKDLQVRQIYKALSKNGKKLIEEYIDIFIEDGVESEDFKHCLEDSESCKEVLESNDRLKEIPFIQELSTHPVHILQSEGKLSPSALIPFCKVGNKLQGVKIKNFSQPVCTAFHPRVFEGQVCYSVDINKIEPAPVFGSGVDKGLELIIDFNQERSIGATFTNKKGKHNSIRLT